MTARWNKRQVSLVLGGPRYQLLCRAHLSDAALMPLEELLKKLPGILF